MSAEQTSIKNYEEFVVREEAIEAADLERRVRLSTVQEQLGAAIRFGRQPNRTAHYYAQPALLRTGLLFPGRTPTLPHDDETEHFALEDDNAHSIVRISKRRDGRVLPDYRAPGVAFQPEEFSEISFSAIGLGSKAQNRTRKSRAGDPDRDASKETELRSGGHVLDGYICRQKSLQSELAADSETYRKLMAHIFAVKNTRRMGLLNADRALFDEKLHGTIEVAALNIVTIKPPVTKTIVGMHRVARRHMYAGNYSSAERDMFTAEYLRLMIAHNTAKLAVAALAIEGCERVKAIKYQPALDREENRKKLQAQQDNAATT